jgi:anaphase-promoting complex subunit 1
MAIIMAGTGDLDCLQRLRYAHGKCTLPSKFGMHLANHMSLGMLFLGGGRYTLGTSHAAVCGLLASFYPRYPLFGYDNRTHLQALRHLWVLAVEPRCLITRDVSSRKIVSQPVTIHLKEADNRISKTMMLAPTLIPDFDAIRDFRIDNSRYWGMTLAYDKFPHIKETFIRNQTLWVQKRRGFLSYKDDASGTDTNIVRASKGVLADVACLERPALLGDTGGQASKDFTRFMTALSSEPSFAVFADLLCRSHDWEDYPGDETQQSWVAYCQAALAECIGDDKPQMLPAYLSLQAIRAQQPHEAVLYTLALIDLFFLTIWYQSTDIARPEYLPLSVIRSVRAAVEDKLDVLKADPEFVLHLRSYSEGLGVDPHGLLDTRRRKFVGRQLAFYLMATNTPSASTLVAVRKLFLESLDAALAKGMQGRAVLTGAKLLMRETVESVFNSDWQWRALSDTLDWWAESRS